ncbi:MAG: pentapeptide repeat-containing protein [Catenulispora sp.]|nr:pentapeptide repeat-containing protein [Catenulispora sp.]
MGREALEQLIDRAVRPDVPLRVLFAALDRYTELLRPALDDEAESPDFAGTDFADTDFAGIDFADTDFADTDFADTDFADTASAADYAGSGDPAVPRHTPSGLDSAIP